MNKKIFIGLIFGLIWFDSYAENDPFLEDFNPSSLNQLGKEYPMVYTQGYAMFRIEAPDAKSVKVSLGLGGKGGNVLKHQADSTGRGTSAGPLDEGLHYYHLTVDGEVPLMTLVP